MDASQVASYVPPLLAVALNEGAKDLGGEAGQATAEAGGRHSISSGGGGEGARSSRAPSVSWSWSGIRLRCASPSSQHWKHS